MISLPEIRFAKVNLDYDKHKLASEVLGLRKNFKSIPAHKKWARMHPKIFVGTQKEIEEVTVVDSDRQLVKRKLHPWYGASLTHVPGEYLSNLGTNEIRNSSTSAWEWREDISAPYLRSIVELLNFEQLHSVRVMMLPANSIGLVHMDSGGDYYKDHISLTLNVENGGSPILFLEKDKIYSVENESAFLFRDDCYHGVPRVVSDRIQIRINGRPNKKVLSDLIDLNTVVLV